jgi:hypothetical protein
MSFRKYGGLTCADKSSSSLTNYYVTATNINVNNNASTSTGTGSNGLTGPTGPTGNPGNTLSPGATGPKGLDGIDGKSFTGNTGPQGLTGPQGVTGPGGILTSYWDKSGTNIYYTNGNVGIGTNNPQASLDVNSNFTLNSSLPSTGISKVAMSSSGQYQTAIGGSNYYVSSNYGITWSQPNTISGISLTALSISQTGQYQVIAGNSIGNIVFGNIYKSTNYGSTFSILTYGQNTYPITEIEISSNGQKIVVGTSNTDIMYISFNGGVSWGSYFNDYNATMGVDGIAMSQDVSANYITVTMNNFGIYKSQNGGTNFIVIKPNNINYKWLGVAMSSTGQYQIASENTTYYIWISLNYGANWTQIVGSNNIAGTNVAITSLNLSSDGKIITGVTSGDGLIWQGVTTNWSTWSWSQLTTTSKVWTSLAVSSDNKYYSAIIGGLYNKALALNVNGSSQFNGDLLPTVSKTYNLGSSALPWKSLFVGSQTIHLGDEVNGFAKISYDTSHNYFALVKTDGTTIKLGETIDSTFIQSIIDNNDLLRLKVGTIDTNNDTSNNITTFENIKQILFDVNSGFDVTQGPTGGSAIVSMNSTFKYWNVDGHTGIAASGVDTVNFVSGTGINITAKEINGTKTLKIDAVSSLGPTGASGIVDSSILSNYAQINDPSFSGIPLAPTPLPNGNVNQIATIGYVNDAISGITGGSSSSNSDLGILQNTPPAPLAVDPSGAVVSTTAILIRFTPPSQSTWGFANFLIPAINSLNFEYDGSGGYNLVQSISASTCVRVYPNSAQDITNNASIVSGICFINSDNINVYGTNISLGTKSVWSITYNGDTRNYYVVVVQNSKLYNTNNVINVWYANYNLGNVNKTPINFTMYVSIGVPAVPSNFKGNAPSITTTTIDTLWDASLSDTSNPTIQTPFDNYKITIFVDPSNIPIGYNWSAPASSFQNPAGNVTSYKITNLYPSTSYKAYIQAKNTTNANYSSNSNTILFKTNNLSPLVTTSITQSLTIPTTSTWKQMTAFSFALNDNVSNLYYNTSVSLPTILTTNIITIPIHNTSALIASTSNNIRNMTIILEKDISGNSNYSRTNGSVVTYGGFGVTTPASSQTNNLIITPSASTDQYSGIAGSTGYYQQANVTFGINLSSTAPMVDSNLINTLSIFDISNTIGTKSFPFYYTVLPASPPTATLAVTLGTITPSMYKQIFGINIFTNPIPINTTLTNISNIGTYFCNTNNFLTYGISGGSLSNNIVSTIPSSNISNNRIVTPFSYTNNIMNFSTTTYLTSVNGFNVTIQGLVLTSNITTATSFSLLYDPNTTNFINNLPTVIPTLTTTLVNGFNSIIPTNVISGGSSSPYYYSNTTTTYSSTAYNHSQLLTTVPALLMSNGAYITPSYNGTIATTNYIDYSGFNSNSGNNYTTINSSFGMRYVSFVWKLPTISTGSIGNVTVKITFKNANLTKPGTTEIIVGGAASGSLELYYRLEDPASLTNTGSLVPSSTDYYSTVWIKGNTTGASLNSSNYAVSGSTAPLNEATLSGAVTSISSNVATFTLTIPTISKSAPNVNFYLRVGLNSSVNNNAITNIQCSL